MESSWSSLGRRYAFIHAIGYVIASIVYVLFAFRITTPAAPVATSVTPGSAQALIAFQQATWPQVLLFSLVFVVAFFALMPMAAALREKLGGDPPAILASMAIQTGAVLGIIGSLLTLSVRSVTLRHTDAETAVAATVVDSIVAPAAWIQIGFLFFVGAGVLYAGRIGLQRAALPRGLGQLSVVIGAIYLFATGVNIVGAISDPATARTMATVFQLTVAAGGSVLAPIWAIYLGQTLAPRAATVRAPTRA